MHTPKQNLSVTIAILFLFVLSCNTSHKHDKTSTKSVTTKIDSTGKLIKFNSTVFSIPSPYQAVILIKKQNISYNKELLNSVNNYKKYVSSFEKAINLGVYGADLGYLNLYEQKNDAVTYFSLIKGLADKLNLLSAFDKKTVKRIENNINSQDSLLTIMSNTYQKADGFLRDNNQEHLACVVLAGGWIESLHLLTQLYLQTNNPEILQRIGENKKPLDNLLQILAPYSEMGEDYSTLISDLIDLASIFEQIKIDYTFEKVETNTTNKITTLYSKTNTKISKKILEEIQQKIEKIRNHIIK